MFDWSETGKNNKIYFTDPFYLINFNGEITFRSPADFSVCVFIIVEETNFKLGCHYQFIAVKRLSINGI